jgi:hypothetical protein
MPKLPTAELVAVAYAKRILNLAGYTAPVVTTLPGVETWKDTGAVQVDGIVGSTSRENNIRDVVVALSAWGARPGSDKPPWGQANGLLEPIRDSAFLDWSNAMPLDLEPANTYSPVLVQSVTTLGVQGEPRRVPDPDTSRAHYVMELRLFWTVA